MLRVAAGEPRSARDPDVPRGHAIEVRIYAEDPGARLPPEPRAAHRGRVPEGRARRDVGRAGHARSRRIYDPLLAKIVVHGDDRADRRSTKLARRSTRRGSLASRRTSNTCARSREANRCTRGAHHDRAPSRSSRSRARTRRSADARHAHDRAGLSGAARLLGRRRAAVGADGSPELSAGQSRRRQPRRRARARAHRVGADARVRDGRRRRRSPARACRRRSTASRCRSTSRSPCAPGRCSPSGALPGPGAARTSPIRHGFDVPEYLGSRSTFTLGGFGGHAGRPLRKGRRAARRARGEHRRRARRRSTPRIVPELVDHWTIGVMYGPHGAPDFFTERDIETFFATDWEVHYNSARTGVRLIGPKPEWARPDGGEAGLHPSNIHDNAYAVGSVDFTGDMPIVLGPDGPSLGGFVCPGDGRARRALEDRAAQARRARALRADFRRAGAAARARAERLDRIARAPRGRAARCRGAARAPSCATCRRSGERPRVVYRPSGDHYLLVEYGPLVLDLALRFRVHALMEWLAAERVPGIIDITPGIRSLQVHYDAPTLPLRTARRDPRARRKRAARASRACVVPTRIVQHAALVGRSGDAARHRKVHASRAPGRAVDAEQPRIHPPHQRSRVDRRREAHRVRRELPRARPGRRVPRRSGGDAARSAASPGDDQVQSRRAPGLPKTRSASAARTSASTAWRARAAISSSAARCRSGTASVRRATFATASPGCCASSTRSAFIRSEPKSCSRCATRSCTVASSSKSARNVFASRATSAFSAKEADGIRAFKATQQAAFEAERRRWAGCRRARGGRGGQDGCRPATRAAHDGAEVVESHVHGSVWQVHATVGARVRRGEVLVVLESMKMEIADRIARGRHGARALCRAVGEKSCPARRSSALRRRPEP